ncbi:MAG: prepilin peptidase [Clostridia bacterium]|nr:prepilin peptidase [Clostridia bacterium]
MNIFLYAIIFIIGTLFGSFYTLAVYRIPKDIDIIKKHSYCPNCNNKLGFLELIPVLSYIFLGGKCKHCGQKIRIRYLLLELLGGITFVTLAILFKIEVYNLNMSNIIIYVFAILYLTAIILISGIDKEYIRIDKRVLAYGIIISILYMIYLYTIGDTSIYRYAIYLAVYIILLAADTILLKKYAKVSYIIEILILLNTILIFGGTAMFLMTVVMSVVAILIYMLLHKTVQKNVGNKKLKIEEMPIGFYIGASNIILFFMMTFVTEYFI